MIKKAAIYIRVSSEKQSEKVSPQKQEEDCLEYCNNKNYVVVGVYRDIEKYRVGKRLVEPSGTRYDRPEFRKMLNDADNGNIDIIVAWKEDRLYRGVNRGMLAISERVTQKIFSVELIKENYDANFAVLKAWAAGFELQAKRDRTTMGVIGRLQEGKVWCSIPPYGLCSDGNGYFAINDTEAEVVRIVWDMYANNESIVEIRKHLLSNGYKDRNSNNGHPPKWSLASIREILKKDYYYTGKYKIKWDGKVYEIDIPTIISKDAYLGVKRRKKAYVEYPANAQKNNTLCVGKIYCRACERRMGTRFLYRNKNGRDYKWHYYRCNNLSDYSSKNGCAKTVGVNKTDARVWEKIWDIISNKDSFEDMLEKHISTLRDNESSIENECKQLETLINDTIEERQKVISWARKNIITDEDLEIQLRVLNEQLNGYQKELYNRSTKLKTSAEDLANLARIYRDKLLDGLTELNANLEGKEAEIQFKYRKKLINSLVSKIYILPDKDIQVVIRITEESIVNGDEQAHWLNIIYNTPSLLEITI